MESVTRSVKHLLIVASLLLLSPIANAGPLGIDVGMTGPEAEKLMVKIMETEGAELVENSVGLTIWKFQDITCSLYGSHGSSGRPEVYQCTLGL